jgi:hypothetical protein
MKPSQLKSVILAGIALASLAVPAFAQGTAEERSACMGDAFQFCSAAIPDVAQVTACLTQNKSKLSPACQAEFDGQTRLRPSHLRK